jgi:hypothetical protein
VQSARRFIDDQLMYFGTSQANVGRALLDREVLPVLLSVSQAGEVITRPADLGSSILIASMWPSRMNSG